MRIFPCGMMRTLAVIGAFDNENILGGNCISRGRGEDFS